MPEWNNQIFLLTPFSDGVIQEKNRFSFEFESVKVEFK